MKMNFKKIASLLKKFCKKKKKMEKFLCKLIKWRKFFCLILVRELSTKSFYLTSGYGIDLNQISAN